VSQRRRGFALAVAAGALALAFLAAGCVAQGEPLKHGVMPPGTVDDPPRAGWASPDHAQVRPGAVVHTPKRDCASNFLFIRPDNSSVFLGTTANCFRDQPLGTLATVGGPENVGVLVYSSWQTMDEVGEKDATARDVNDFAVVRMDESARPVESPALLGLAGPRGMADAGSVGAGSALQMRVVHDPVPEWRDAVVATKTSDWGYEAYATTPPLPGEMGGPVVDASGHAVGVVVGLGVTPMPGAVTVARLDALMQYASEHAKLYMELESPTG
jgi:hypothetical protein